jgi:dTDP-4-amino-4,6-dideoxygalactose transaminase
VKVEFYKHNLDDEDVRRLAEACRGVMLTTGAEVKAFEERFAAYLGLPHAVGLTSCTAALHLALLACGVGAGDEVITTPMTFIATSNAALYVGARPVFVDVDPVTALMDPALIEAAITSKTRAIIPVHLYGQMCDMRAIRAIADRHGLKVIEDCAHAIESARDGVRPGQLGDAACFSFYATKNITSGEGGAVATRHADVAGRVRLLRQHGMSASAEDRHTQAYRHWDMEALGWKYNMTNLDAAMLQGQLDRIETLWAKREQVSRAYEQRFDVQGVAYPKVAAGAKSARHLFTIWVDPAGRDQVLQGLQQEGVGVAVNYRAVHLLTYYAKTFGFTRGAFPHAERIGDSTVTLPLYPRLTDAEIAYVVDAVARQVGAGAGRAPAVNPVAR